MFTTSAIINPPSDAEPGDSNRSRELSKTNQKEDRMSKYSKKDYGEVRLWYAKDYSASTVVISSHGGLMAPNKVFTAPALLRFRCHVNQSTWGQVSAMLSVSDSEFQDEPKGTQSIRDEMLTHFPDKDKDVKETVEGGFDVITIKPNHSVQFGPYAHWLGTTRSYQSIICLFCRVSTVATRVKVM